MESNDDIRKVIFLGDAGVGKTSLLTKYLNPLDDIENITPTISGDFEKIIISNKENKQVELQVWDTAGQEKYRSMIQLYMRNVQIAFICFDYNNIEVTKINDWCDLLLNYSPNSIIFLIATKTDKCENESELDEIRNYMNSAKSKIDYISAVFITSAKTGLGVDDLFLEAANYELVKNDSIIPQNDPLKSNVDNEDRKANCC